MRRQREEEDYWDEYEDYDSDSSCDESDCDEHSSDEPSPDEPSSDEEEEVTGANRRGEGTREGLGDDEGGYS